MAPCLLLLLALLFPTTTAAPPAATPPSVSGRFEQTLETEGLDAALAELTATLADSTQHDRLDPYEIGIGLPSRLVVRHEREAALAVVEAIGPWFGDHPRYPQELGLAHLRCGNAEQAREALTRAKELGGRPDIAWMLERIDELAALEKEKAKIEDRVVPGEPTDIDGPWFGQDPPGRTPEVFAPGYINTTAHEYHISLAPDGREIVFSRSGVGTLVTRWTGEGWTVPEVVHLIDEHHLTEESNLTPDGEAIVFCGRANIHEPRILYRSERSGAGWGPPKELFPGMYATSALDGSLYYTARGEGRDIGVIVRREWLGNAYGDTMVVGGDGINTDAPDAHPWISPDGNLLVFDSYRQPGMGIFAAFRHADGRWGKAIPLCERLGIPPVGQPALSPDLRYLFFCLAGDMYWVDAGFLEDVKRESLAG